ncbi:hypothetical protein [Actinomadura sp. DC4]|uniref:hypothetical protein n=1 Tax=Actinomadura sp. DC4 TaxID=3055069 RepID=UPI0025B26F63|nr:hypothetical protein [Actinomadura sp. DC4]MDN3352834.1 hypothetical protein [Actinomadura sp. DC4]
MNMRILAAVGGLALLTGACGHAGEHEAAGPSKGASTYEQAVAFAKCMRTHGDPSWPDPGPDGAFPNNNGSLDKSSSRFKTASAACKKLEPGSPPQSVFQADYRKLLKFSACMRAHGLPKFPDPILEDHGVGYKGDDINPNSPQYKTAHQACRALAPEGM